MEKAKILLVDDRPENLLSLEALIEAEDREIYTAESGNEGLKLVRKHEFALILSDVQMPEMDGFEMVEIIRTNKKTRHIPIIFVTAISKEEQYVNKGYSEGAVDYLFKPLDPKIVVAKVDIFVTLWRQKQMLQKQNSELEALNEQKNKFLGMAAHDIRNPLSIINFYSKDLLTQIEDKNSELYKGLDYIYASSNFIKNLVDELLDIAKIESGRIELTMNEVNPSDFLKEIIQLNRVFSDKKAIEILERFDLEEDYLSFDKQKLTQVLNNILTNAIKFSNPHTTISVGAMVSDKVFTFWVKDNGQGIPETELSELFHPFTTTSVKATAGEPSTGLGLTIAKKIVEAHHGEITVESELGKGTQFTIKIPAIRTAKKELSSSAAASETNLIGEGLDVLLIDDDLMVLTFMSMVFSRLGFSVATAIDSEAALAYVIASQFDFIFTDIHLPGTSGMEIAAAIRKINKETPIFGLTAGLSDAERAKCYEVGMNDIFIKAIGKMQIESIINKYMPEK